ncbi:D-aminoacyl-tRNA deacylase [Halalkalibacter okhensis]|uniref:D-aminoacyl-tRNA deacylase n=1 Tax=Halalkalibacter okhensis TaxID=333138 RepID=A0A0B0IL18_9BACI|nr:D-aminoacyl-tRNA deacylase [Halalkalibacter okhensis]KHF41990.1 D-tyrosyl-tRNA(Tyr) deacylase [Halalkalibacter okhensis]
MKVVLQRTKASSVSVEGEVIGQIDAGLTLLVGITHEDTSEDVKYIVDKIINLRIFEDANGKMNHSLLDVKGQVLSISQFTLYGDCKKGRRPNFMNAAKPDVAKELYDEFNHELSSKGIDVQTGEFGAMMEVSLINDGPVTLIVESLKKG